MIQLILGYIGIWTPFIFFLFSLLLLRHKPTYRTYYIIGSIINFILNSLLKLIIKEPRPDGDYRLIDIGTSNGKRFGPDVYGMPSGHAQISAFNLAFITASLHSSAITCLYLIFTIISLGQRYIYNNHTLLQLFVGLCIGLATGIATYIVANKKVRGDITEKKDDNGPL